MNGPTMQTDLGKSQRTQVKEKKPFNWKPAAVIAGIAGLIGVGYWSYTRDKPTPTPTAVYEQPCIDSKIDSLTGEITTPHAPEDITYRRTNTISKFMGADTITTENSVAAPRVVLNTGGKEYVLLTNAIFAKGDSARIIGKATAPGTFRGNECIVNNGVEYGVRRSDVLKLIGGDSGRTLVGADSVIADYAVIDSVIAYKPKTQ